MQREIPQSLRFATWRDHGDTDSSKRKAQSSIEVFGDGDVGEKALCHRALTQLARKLRLVSEHAVHATYIKRVGAGMRFDVLDTR
jgi:hypothetical protein